ncbi:MAG: hypothetical protein ACYC1Q_07675 [Bacteroidia bacterium]
MPTELEVDNLARFAGILNTDGGIIDDTAIANTFGSNANTVDCFTAGPFGALVDSIEVVSTDSAIKILHLYIDKGAGDPIPLGAFSIPLNSGSNGAVLPFDVLSNANTSHLPISNQGKRYIRLEAGWTIKAGILAALTATKKIWVNCSGLDFEA